MASHPRMSGPRGIRCGRQLHPCVLPLEQRLVPTLTYPSLTFPGIAGITFDSSGDVFVSYNSTTGSSGQQQSVAEVPPNGDSFNASVFSTTGALAFPGDLTAVGSSASLPSLDGNDILELEPDGQLFAFNPVSGTSSQYDNLANDTANASKVFDVQTGASVNLSSQISLAGATYGDFGIYANSLVVSAETNNWDFVVRLTYGGSVRLARSLSPRRPATVSRPHPRGLPSTQRERSSPRCPTYRVVPPRRLMRLSASASSMTPEAAPRRSF